MRAAGPFGAPFVHEIFNFSRVEIPIPLIMSHMGVSGERISPDFALSSPRPPCRTLCLLPPLPLAEYEKAPSAIRPPLRKGPSVTCARLPFGVALNCSLLPSIPRRGFGFLLSMPSFGVALNCSLLPSIPRRGFGFFALHAIFRRPFELLTASHLLAKCFGS